MSINTAERRRSVIDFGKGARGTGMPIPSGAIGAAARSHLLNLYPGIAPSSSFFFFWRNRSTPVNPFQSRATPSSTWRGKTSASNTFRTGPDIPDA